MPVPNERMRRSLPLTERVAERIAGEAAKPRELHLKAQPKRALTFVLGRLARGTPIVLLSVTLPNGACYLSHERAELRDGGVDAPFVIPDSGPPPDFGPPPLCWGGEERFTVELPPPGVPADASLLCVEPGDAVSPDAARVTLTLDPGDRMRAHGVVTVEASLLGDVVGTPTVEITEPGFALWTEATVGPVSRDGDVFRFDVVWPFELVGYEPPSYDRSVFDVRLDLVCADGTTKRVIAQTIVHMCLEDDRSISFASSGEECRTCAIIAEMAPTPIIPDELPDELPLQKGMLLALRPVGRFENAVVLLAEHGQGTHDVKYAWHATAGRLTAIEDDVAIWEPPAGGEMHAVQVVVETKDAAAIATYRRGGGL